MHDDLSLERIIPDHLDGQDAFDQVTLQLHLERYTFAILNGKPGEVLDIACGSGYGSFQVMDSEKFRSSRMTAVDIDGQAIQYAKKRYAHPSIQFVCADAMHYSGGHLFDTVISLETIEHLNDPEKFISSLHAVLQEDGVLIISAPVTPSTDGNPYHFSDFTARSFRKLLKGIGFVEFACLEQTQRYSLPGIFNPKNKRLEKMRNHIWLFYLKHPKVFYKRIVSLLADGATNKYLVLALKKI
jgi:ubiquinone/menaquinone biosynthesis C-methylase UbiE